MTRNDYATDVFINCPFDRRYKPLFEAIVFSVFDCGFRARCTLEIGDSSQVRIDTLFGLISKCKYGLHDISRTDLDSQTKLPRFNMPFELGMFLAAKRFGTGRQSEKVCLILDSEKHRYQKYISDISGQDIRTHRGRPREAIKVVRDWLRDASKRTTIPGGSEIHRRYRLFLQELPILCSKLRLEKNELTFNDYALLVETWLRENG